MSKNPKINLASSFGEAIEAQDRSQLKQKVKELELELEKNTKEILSIKISAISPNPDQPRQSFYVVNSLVDSLKKHGQKQPIVLVEKGEGKKIIFDGECRWRAAKILGWETLKAIIIPYDPETFDSDVLIAATQRNNLNSLDLAEALAQKIISKMPELKVEDVVRQLNTLVKRVKRQGKTELLLSENWEELNLSPIEALICETIFFYDWNPLSINSNKFPLLKLPEEIKQAIREQGLKDHSASAIAKIDHLKIKQIKEKEARILRKKLIQEALTEKWTRTRAGERVREEIEQLSPSNKPVRVQQDLDNCYKAIKAIPLDSLSTDEKESLLAVVSELTKQLQNSLNR